jgi:hypothetical protein
VLLSAIDDASSPIPLIVMTKYITVGAVGEGVDDTDAVVDDVAGALCESVDVDVLIDVPLDEGSTEDDGGAGD